MYKLYRHKDMRLNVSVTVAANISGVASGAYQTIEHIMKNQRGTTQTTSQKGSLSTDLYAYVPEPIKVFRISHGRDTVMVLTLGDTPTKGYFRAEMNHQEPPRKVGKEPLRILTGRNRGKGVFGSYVSCKSYAQIKVTSMVLQVRRHVVFNHSQPTLGCGNRHTLTCQPRGGRERLAEGCSFRTKGFDGIEEFLGCLKDCQFRRRPYREGFGAFAWRIPILVTVLKTVLRHSKLFEGFKVQLGEDPIQARRGGLGAGREGTSSSLSVECNVCIYGCIAFESSNVVQIVGHVEGPCCIHLIISQLVVELVESLNEDYSTVFLEEFNDFLTLYPIPSEYHVILPKSNQTIFDAPPGYVRLYTHSFSLANLRLPLTEFFCEVLEYFQVYISRLNPFGCAKLTTFVVMCKAYGCEPSVDLFRGFFNMCRADKWLNFAKRSEKHIPNLLPKSISPSVCVFPDPILFLAGLKPSWEYGQQRPAIMAGGKEMAFRNFIYTEDDEGLSFLPKEPSPGFGTGDSEESLNPELFVVHPSSVDARIKDRKCKTRGGSSRPPVKRKLKLGSSTSRTTRAKTSSSKGDAPFFTVSDDDKGLHDVLELKDATACHIKISAITPPAWKNHLDNHIDVELRSRELLHIIEKLRGEFDVMRSRERAREEECEGLRVKCEAAMTKFEKNPVAVALREKISALSIEVKEHKLNLDRMMLESQKWSGYQQSLSTLESKVTSLEAEKARLEAVEMSLRKEVDELKQDRREVVSKVVPYAAMELVHSDDMGSLVGRLVSSAILYGRCRAYEQVADMKEPFELSKVKGYRSSYKKDHTQASNDFATTTFPWLDEFVADPSATIEVLLSKISHPTKVETRGVTSWVSSQHNGVNNRETTMH
ncbi:probable xyloglucan endotransglucosylase/hydrolase protein 30 [Tanacetum coccineum]